MVIRQTGRTTRETGCIGTNGSELYVPYVLTVTSRTLIEQICDEAHAVCEDPLAFIRVLT